MYWVSFFLTESEHILFGVWLKNLMPNPMVKHKETIKWHLHLLVNTTIMQKSYYAKYQKIISLFYILLKYFVNYLTPLNAVLIIIYSNKTKKVINTNRLIAEQWTLNTDVIFDIAQKSWKIYKMFWLLVLISVNYRHTLN